MKKEKRLTSEEFLKTMNKLWKAGPKVKYQNPDRWLIHLLSRNLNNRTIRKEETHQSCWVVKRKE